MEFDELSMIPTKRKQHHTENQIILKENALVEYADKKLEGFFTKLTSTLSAIVPLKKQEQNHSETKTASNIEKSWEIMDMSNSRKKTDLVLQTETNEEKIRRFLELLSAPEIDSNKLRKLCWNGIPAEFRGVCWQLLLGCLPLESKMREKEKKRKRKQYKLMMEDYYIHLSGKKDQELLNQILVDCPRTNPKGAPPSIFKSNEIQKILERVLLVWSKEHSTIAYYQGLGDIVAQFILANLSMHIELENFHASYVTEEILDMVEADTYWCTKYMLDKLEPYYNLGLFPGIDVMMEKMRTLVKIVDVDLFKHMQEQKVEVLQFSFRWMLCFLTRELNMICLQRLWDTYFAEGNDFGMLHIYVCAGFLTKWSEQLKQKDFSDMIIYLQHDLPTDDWSEIEAKELIERAYAIGKAEKSINTSANLYALEATGVVVAIFVIFVAYYGPLVKK